MGHPSNGASRYERCKVSQYWALILLLDTPLSLQQERKFNIKMFHHFIMQELLLDPGHSVICSEHSDIFNYFNTLLDTPLSLQQERKFNIKMFHHFIMQALLLDPGHSVICSEHSDIFNYFNNT